MGGLPIGSRWTRLATPMSIGCPSREAAKHSRGYAWATIQVHKLIGAPRMRGPCWRNISARDNLERIVLCVTILHGILMLYVRVIHDTWLPWFAKCCSMVTQQFCPDLNDFFFRWRSSGCHKSNRNRNKSNLRHTLYLSCCPHACLPVCLSTARFRGVA